MRPPFKDLFAVEPLSKWKMTGVVVLAALLSAAVAVVLAAGGMFAFIESAFSRHIDSVLMNRFLWIAIQNICVVVGLVTFANIVVAYWVLHCVNSAEVRALLRWALHVSIWVEVLYLTSTAWTYVTFI